MLLKSFTVYTCPCGAIAIILTIGHKERNKEQYLQYVATALCYEILRCPIYTVNLSLRF